MKHELKGEQFGVKLVQRGPHDLHACVQLLSEDDDNWFEVGHAFSSYWLNDLINVLTVMREYMHSLQEDPTGYGWLLVQKEKA